jgi:hypothetical protein
MFDEGSRPSGGEYIDPKTNDVLTGKNISSANISVKEGTGIYRNCTIEWKQRKRHLQNKNKSFQKTAGWKWMVEYADLPTLVSVQKGKHYYLCRFSCRSKSDQIR